jgi:hypothetical protein
MDVWELNPEVGVALADGLYDSGGGGGERLFLLPLGYSRTHTHTDRAEKVTNHKVPSHVAVFLSWI